jgi:hypothetical protein
MPGLDTLLGNLQDPGQRHIAQREGAGAPTAPGMFVTQ